MSLILLKRAYTCIPRPWKIHGLHTCWNKCCPRDFGVPHRFCVLQHCTPRLVPSAPRSTVSHNALLPPVMAITSRLPSSSEESSSDDSSLLGYLQGDEDSESTPRLGLPPKELSIVPAASSTAAGAFTRGGNRSGRRPNVQRSFETARNNIWCDYFLPEGEYNCNTICTRKARPLWARYPAHFLELEVRNAEECPRQSIGRAYR